MISTRQDAIANFRYDPKTKRYRWREGAGKNQFASKEAVLEQTQRYIVRLSQEMVDLVEAVQIGELQGWQLERAAGEKLKQIAIAQTFLGTNGYENATDEDWLATGRFLKQQYYQGRDEQTGDRYGLKYLFQDYNSGKISEAKLKQRLGLYAQSGKTMFWDARSRFMERQGKPYAYRKLGQAEHCADCVAYSRMAPQSVVDIVKPGERCDCHTNCKCSLVFVSLEDAVKRGAKVAA